MDNRAQVADDGILIVTGTVIVLVILILIALLNGVMP